MYYAFKYSTLYYRHYTFFLFRATNIFWDYTLLRSCITPDAVFYTFFFSSTHYSYYCIIPISISPSSIECFTPHHSTLIPSMRLLFCRLLSTVSLDRIYDDRIYRHSIYISPWVRRVFHISLKVSSLAHMGMKAFTHTLCRAWSHPLWTILSSLFIIPMSVRLFGVDH